MSSAYHSKVWTEAEVRNMLKRHCKMQGGQATVARDIGVSRSHINGIISGRKRATGDILAYLGLERVEYIVELEDES